MTIIKNMFVASVGLFQSVPVTTQSTLPLTILLLGCYFYSIFPRQQIISFISESDVIFARCVFFLCVWLSAVKQIKNQPTLRIPPLVNTGFSLNLLILFHFFSLGKPEAKSKTLWLHGCFIYIFVIWLEVPFMQEVLGVLSFLFLDTDKLKIALRARKVSGAFEKQALYYSKLAWEPAIQSKISTVGQR